MTPVPKQQAIALLRKSLDEMESLPRHGDKGENLTEWDTWMRNTLNRVRRIFGEEAEQLTRLDSLLRSVAEEDFAVVRQSEGRRSRAVLESYLTEVDETWDETPATSRPKREEAKEIFIVHGNNRGPLNHVARKLEQWGLGVVVLHEKANLGSIPLFVKLQNYSRVDYVVVLLTPDDEGRAVGIGTLTPRARQNVVFELGYFLGALGTEKVCTLYVEGVELPSDFVGSVHIKYSEKNDSWDADLRRELEAQGLI